MSFEDLMKLKEKLGAKVYDEAVFGQHRVREKKIKQQEFKRGNKNRPREMGVKRPVPLLGKEKILANEKTGPRDPRFDSNCGEYDAKKFKENFSFVSEIKERELVELKEQLKTSTDPKEQKKIKYLIQRMQNQNTEQKKLKIRQEVLEEHKLEIKKAKKEFKKPHFTTDRTYFIFCCELLFQFIIVSILNFFAGERKTEELVKQYLDLKNSGQLNKHLEKRRKKNAQRDRKKFSFD